MGRRPAPAPLRAAGRLGLFGRRVMNGRLAFGLLGGLILAGAGRAADDEAKAAAALERMGAAFDKAVGDRVTGVHLRPKAAGAGLKDLRALPAVRRLGYFGPLVTDAAAKEIAELANLDDLALFDTRVTDA